MKKEIILKVDKAGKTEVEAFGFQGPECENATSWLEKALGLITKRKAKPERFRMDRNVLRLH
jgi:hypothetical protein